MPDPDQEQRRLAAVMFTDIVGYTSLTQSDESLALELLESHNRLLRPIFSKHRGKEIKTIGDSFLIEFDSATDAVKCAVEVQTFLRNHNAASSEDSKIRLRIGIHLGDVVHKGGDIFGDAVNIASRIEPIAPPEGICISEQVYDQVRNKLPYQFSRLESKELKNVHQDIRLFEVIVPRDPSQDKKSTAQNRIAVLPFANISPDPADEYFADGMTEEIINRLSQVKGLRVIARTSVMKYKKKDKDASEIGSALGVQTLVEGSVRKAGNKIRVTAQLIDAATEEHLWSSRYDKDLDDVFAVQSDIASSIIKSLPSSVTGARVVLSPDRDTDNMTAYSYFLKARRASYEHSGPALQEALALHEEAVKLDPKFTRAWTEIGSIYIRLGTKSLLSYERAMNAAHLAAQRAVESNPRLAEVHWLLSQIAWTEDDTVNDEKEAMIAIDLNPSFSDSYTMLGLIKSSKGFPKEAMKNFRIANELDPMDPVPMRFLGILCFYTGRTSEAEALLGKYQRIDPFEVALIKTDHYMATGEYELAEKELKFMESYRPEDIIVIAFRGYLSALKGDRQRAEDVIKTLSQKFKDGASTVRFIGNVKYFLGEMDEFFDAMFKSVDAHVLDPMAFRYSPLFEKARKDPRYREVLIRNKLDPDLQEDGYL